MKALQKEELCACGCKLPHNLAVSRVVSDNSEGYPTRSVIWYRTMACRIKHQGGES